uniref:GAT domain-containing protein n=2 Tax=Schistocephalus solidus TaxID=70667 RepID=A0A0V0J2D8_SCHSO
MVVQTNIHILNDMLTELQPDSVNPDDLELLQELNETCHLMQQRVAEFLAQVADDAVTLSLLQLNDELNGAFQRYERFERYRLRAMRAMISNSPQRAVTAPTSMPALTFTTSRSTQAHQPAQQSLQSHPAPLAITGPDAKSSDEGEDYDDDDDELLDAIAEQPRTFPPSTAEDLIDISSWAHHRSVGQAETTVVTGTVTDIVPAPTNGQQGTVSENLAALESLRLDGGFINNLQVTLSDECTTNQLQSIFGPSCQNSNTTQTQCTPGGNSGFLIDPLIPVPAVVLTRPETKELQSSGTGTDRRLDESLLLFDT